MTEQQATDLFQLIQKFCSDNFGQKITEWNTECFLNRAKMKLESICKADQKPQQQASSPAQQPVPIHESRITT